MSCNTLRNQCDEFWQDSMSWVAAQPCNGAPERLALERSQQAETQEPVHSAELAVRSLLYVDQRRVHPAAQSNEAPLSSAAPMVEVEPDAAYVGSVSFLTNESQFPSNTQLRELWNANQAHPLLAIHVLNGVDGSTSVQAVFTTRDAQETAFGAAADGNWRAELGRMAAISDWGALSSPESVETAPIFATSPPQHSTVNTTATARCPTCDSCPEGYTTICRPPRAASNQAHHLDSPVGLHFRVGGGLYYTNAVFNEDFGFDETESTQEPTRYAYSASIMLRAGSRARLGFIGGTALRRGALEVDFPIAGQDRLLVYGGISAGSFDQSQIVAGVQFGISYRLVDVIYFHGSIQPLYNIDFGATQMVSVFGLEMRL
jgi:hypothetical protein